MRADEEGLAAAYSPGGEPPVLSVGWNAVSPIHGQTPGPSVVQEGRLSLEIATQNYKDENEPQRGLTSVEKILRPKGLRRNVELTKVDAHHRAATSSTAELDTFGERLGAQHPQPAQPPQQAFQRLTPALPQSVVPHSIDYKLPLEELPQKLVEQINQTVATAKLSTGLTNFDASRIQNALIATVQNNSLDNDDSDNDATKAPGMPRSATNATNVVQGLAIREPDNAGSFFNNICSNGQSNGLKRPRSSDLEEYEDPDLVRRPAKRLQRMNELYGILHKAREDNAKIDYKICQVKSEIAEVAHENSQLWAALAHIGAAMHAAIEERDASTAPAAQPAASTQTVPAATGPSPALVPAPGLHANLPILTPGTITLAALFSPNGDDIFAGCNLFTSPVDRNFEALHGRNLEDTFLL